MTIGKCYERKPSELVKEARKAFECGLYIASLSVLVTIPDICAHLVRESWPENDKAAERFDERWWCATYLGLPSEVSDCCVTKHEDKSPDEIDGVLSRLLAEEGFTTSDFSQLRNAVLHAGSALVEGFGDKFSPYHAIGICITDSDSQLILGTGGYEHSQPRRQGNRLQLRRDVEPQCHVIKDGGGSSTLPERKAAV